MKKGFCRRMTMGVVFAFFAIITLSGTAWSFGHYVPGSLGLGAGTLPPPGIHYAGYNLYYTADTMVDGSGNKLNLDADLTVFANVNQFVYVTDKTILGGWYTMDLIVPVVYTDLKLGALGYDDSDVGVGDLCVEPFALIWHRDRYDFGLGLAFYLPTAPSSQSVSPGRGFYSVMESIGGTYYFDKAKTWDFSLYTRWLQNGENRNTDITEGANMVAEYGLGKSIPNGNKGIFKCGLVGYTYAQLTEDSGTGATDDKYKGNAIGAEARYMTFKPLPLQFSLRYQQEYGVENGTEGDSFCFTLIGSF